MPPTDRCAICGTTEGIDLDYRIRVYDDPHDTTRDRELVGMMCHGCVSELGDILGDSIDTMDVRQSDGVCTICKDDATGAVGLGSYRFTVCRRHGRKLLDIAGVVTDL